MVKKLSVKWRLFLFINNLYIYSMIELKCRSLIDHSDFRWYRAFVDRSGCLPKPTFFYLSKLYAN